MQQPPRSNVNEVPEDMHPFRPPVRKPKPMSSLDQDIVAKAKSDNPTLRSSVERTRARVDYKRSEEGNSDQMVTPPIATYAESQVNDRVNEAMGNDQQYNETQYDAPVPPTPVQHQSAPTGTPVNTRPSHPILQEMRQEFGVGHLNTIDREIGGRLFTFRNADSRDKLFADTVSNYMSPTNIQATYPFAIVCSCICAIDSVPIYEIFDIDVSGASIQNTLYPPPKIRVAASERLFDELSEMLFDLRDKLIRAYNHEYQSSLVTSYLDRNESMKRAFVCTHEECDHEIFEIPMENPSTKEVLPYYCQYHGTVMEQKQRDIDSPLA